MKLRNKKTGEVVDLSIFGISLGIRKAEQPIYRSIAELNEEWEDYEPKEPLIKDEKIRKAVRAWADACYLKEANFTQGCVFQYGWSEIDFGGSCSEDIATGHYTIDELCGEEGE